MSRKSSHGGIFLVVLIGLLVLLAAGIGGLIGGYYYLAKDLPSPGLIRPENYRPPIITQVFADDGTVIAEYASQRRKVLPLEQIPKIVIQAFISTEDKRFFQHEGIDPVRFLGAIYHDLKEWERDEGGSTLTMQMARSFFLTRDKKIGRKLREMIMAVRIERYLTKQQILFLYLNHIDLGRNCFGVAAAAELYFGKEVKDLSLAEAAMLAGIPPAPSRYNPINSLQMAKIKQWLVLKVMADNRVISMEEAKQAYAQPVTISNRRPPQGEAAPYFTEHVRRLLLERYGEKMVYQEGLKVFTTVNLKADQAAAEAVRWGVLGPGGLDRNLGYRGPRGHLEGDTVSRAVEAGEKDQLEDWKRAQPRTVAGNGAPASVPADPDPAPLSEGRTYPGIVARVSNPGDEAWVTIGHSRGRLSADALAFAGRFRKSFKPGDLILVRVGGAQADKAGQNFYKLTLDQDPAIQGSLFSMAVRTGHVKALCGGLDFAKSQFIRPIQAFRQTGSAFKPIVYAAALDDPQSRYTPTTLIVDSPVIFENNAHVSCPRDEVVNCANYHPRNYGNSYSGERTLRDAIAHSINTIAVKVACNICLSYVVDYAHLLGIKSKLPPYPSLALGAVELSLEELSTAFNVFADGGNLVQPVYITRVYDRDGNLLEYEERVSNEDLERARAREEAAANRKKNVYDWTGVTAADGVTALLYAGFPGDGLHSGDDNGGREAPLQAARHLFFDPLRPMAPRQLGEPTWPEYLAQLQAGTYEVYDSIFTPVMGDQVITPATAYIITDLMKSVISEGTATAARGLGRGIAGKTGTTNDWRDAWFIGYTPEILTGVWVGPDDYSYSLGKGMTGGKAALPIWVRFMGKMLAGRKAVEYPVPRGIEFARVDLDTGCLASDFSINVRVEPFKKGAAPKEECPPPLMPFEDNGVPSNYQEMLDQ